jgi:hypothetical protein
MHLIPRPSGRFHSRLWIEEDEFDIVALRTLAAHGLLSDDLLPVNIELLVERLFPCAYTFTDLGGPVMGPSSSGGNGPESEIHERLDRLDNFSSIASAAARSGTNAAMASCTAASSANSGDSVPPASRASSSRTRPATSTNPSCPIPSAGSSIRRIA